LLRNSSICGLLLMSGIDSFKNWRPINNRANPIIKFPQFLICSRFPKVSAKPKPTNGNAIVLILTLNPRIAINQAVTVVPILAPIMTPMDSVSVSNPALEKLTTIKVVAEDDCITEVIKNPVKTPKNLLEVILAKMERILFPASFMSASLITFIPNKKTPNAPSSSRTS